MNVKIGRIVPLRAPPWSHRSFCYQKDFCFRYQREFPLPEEGVCGDISMRNVNSIVYILLISWQYFQINGFITLQSSSVQQQPAEGCKVKQLWQKKNKLQRNIIRNLDLPCGTPKLLPRWIRSALCRGETLSRPLPPHREKVSVQDWNYKLLSLAWKKWRSANTGRIGIK